MNELYVDGGVIGRNPSSLGGTYAYVLVTNGEVTEKKSFVISTRELRQEFVTNNQTEMMALVKGLGALPYDWMGTIYSDSQITLGRAFLDWRWKNIPDWLRDKFHAEMQKLIHWNRIRYKLLSGHPTKEELSIGRTAKGIPVSKFNVMCDEMCREEAMKLIQATI